MDFRHLIVTCLFSKLRLPFDNQKVKENYAILRKEDQPFAQEKTACKQSLPTYLHSVCLHTVKRDITNN